MVDIRHRIGINAPAERVHTALTTTDGLAGWWTRDVTGDPAPGGTLRFRFGGPDRGADMTVVHTDPEHVEWRCVAGPDEWLDTTITFDLKPGTDETVLLFGHANWREPVEFMGHCSTKWAYFLLGLKSGLEGGAATPFPDEVKISSWG